METTVQKKQVQKDLSLLLQHLYRFIDAGCTVAKEFFVAQSVSVDSALASYIVRWTVLHLLRAEASLLQVDAIEELGMSGVSFWYNGYHMRMWKTDDDDVTRLASSSTKEAFCAQLTFWDTELPTTLNLAILWDVDADWHLKVLQIGPPVRQHDGRFVLDWHLDIFLPAESSQTGTVNSAESESTNLHFEPNDQEMDDKQG